MGRSFAQEYLNQKNKAPFETVEINVPNEVQEMFNIILKLNGHSKKLFPKLQHLQVDKYIKL